MHLVPIDLCMAIGTSNSLHANENRLLRQTRKLGLGKSGWPNNWRLVEIHERVNNILTQRMRMFRLCFQSWGTDTSCCVFKYVTRCIWIRQIYSLKVVKRTARQSNFNIINFQINTCMAYSKTINLNSKSVFN